MTVQIIRSESGDELVVLSRREYDALLARAGDADAEDRLLGAAAEEILARVDSGTEAVVDASARLTTLRQRPGPDRS